MNGGALEFPGVFDEPVVEFDTLSAQAYAALGQPADAAAARAREALVGRLTP